VMTTCILGAPGLANSSQLLLRAPVAGKPAASSLQGVRIDAARGTAASAETVEGWRAAMVQDGFGESRARGVPGT
jgi:hypothetical protein